MEDLPPDYTYEGIPMDTYTNNQDDLPLEYKINNPNSLPSIPALDDSQPMNVYNPMSNLDPNMLPSFDPNMTPLNPMNPMMPMMPMMPALPMMPLDPMMPMDPTMLPPMDPNVPVDVMLLPPMPIMPQAPQPPQPQTITININNTEQKTENVSRGRGRGRAKPTTVIASPKVEKEKPKVVKQHLPIFIMGVSIFEIAILIWELILNGGIASPSINPLIGPSAETLITCGAKYGILMRSPYNQWWRWFTPIFLHAGIIHILFNLTLQIRVGVELERRFGTYRIAIIYFLSGVNGIVLSTVFIPAVPTVGASGALMGYMGCLFVDLLQNFKNLKNPCRDVILIDGISIHGNPFVSVIRW